MPQGLPGLPRDVGHLARLPSHPLWGGAPLRGRYWIYAGTADLAERRRQPQPAWGHNNNLPHVLKTVPRGPSCPPLTRG
eukprot:1187693-Prorocentrum_minimum.AAC.1